MSAFDFLTENDKELIEGYIRAFGPTSSSRFDDGCMEGLDVILKEWNEQKSGDLLKMFGGESLILSRPYSYLAQAEALSQKIEDCRHEPACRTFIEWYDHMKHTAGNDIEIVDMQGKPFKDKANWWYSSWYQIDECKTSMCLAANAYLGEDCIVKFPKSGKQMKLFRGMKPMKVLHRIVQEYNGPEDLFDAFRTWHSMCLNQKRMDGELCLSIHPMDFMTMSDNANGWKSCMRWTDPSGSDDDHGDFRSGTVQCMNSPYIIIAYLHNPDHVYHPFGNNTYWNSKQWRELFIVQDGVINEIKGYPFQDENLTNTCLMWIKELATKNLGWTYENEEIDVGREIKVNDEEDILLTYDAGNFMYKDIGAIQKHRGRINIEKLMLPERYLIQESFNAAANKTHYFVTIPYGGQGTCMSCGKPLLFEKSERVMCPNCDTIQVCDCCGEPIYDDDCVYWIDDRDGPVCERCFEDDCRYDDFNSDEYHLMANMTEVWLLLGYDENDKPIFHENIAMTFEPEYEGSNFRSVFPDGYGVIDYEDGWFHGKRNYVTIDGIEEGYRNDACDAFDIYPRNLDKFYAEAIDEYDIVYDYNHQRLFREEEDDE